MQPKEVRERDGRYVLVVLCVGCGHENEVMLPLIGAQHCACGRTMYVDTHTLNTANILEAEFRAKRARG